MNRITLAFLATAALAATPVRAETRISFGIHLGSPVYVPAAPVIVHAPPPVIVYAPPTVVYAPSAVVYAPAHGYWTEIVVKTWVPERWVHARDRWGRHIRHCEPGYHAFRTDRVWVDGRNAAHPTPHHPGYSHGHWGR